MKVKLFARKLDGGHVYLNTIDVPEGTQEWRIPVRQPIDVKFVDGGEIPRAVLTDVRTFVYQHDPLGRALENMPRFLEV